MTWHFAWKCCGWPWLHAYTCQTPLQITSCDQSVIFVAHHAPTWAMRNCKCLSYHGIYATVKGLQVTRAKTVAWQNFSLQQLCYPQARTHIATTRWQNNNMNSILAQVKACGINSRTCLHASSGCLSIASCWCFILLASYLIVEPCSLLWML